jgi:hypothetical protein
MSHGGCQDSKEMLRIVGCLISIRHSSMKSLFEREMMILCVQHILYRSLMRRNQCTYGAPFYHNILFISIQEDHSVVYFLDS